MIFLELFYTFFKIGLFTFGGGYAMLPLIQKEVAAHGWLTEAQLINFVAVSESTPGPFAINVSTYVGMETGGLFGAFCATTGVVMPSFIIILIIAKCYEKFKESKTVQGIMTGLRPAVLGLIATAVVSAGVTVFFPLGFDFASMFTFSFIASAAIFVITLVLALKKVHPILIILIAAVLGIAQGLVQGLV